MKILSLLLAGISIFIYYLVGYKWSEIGTISNIKIYIMGTAIFFIVLIASDLLLRFVLTKRKWGDRTGMIVGGLAVCGGGVYGLHLPINWRY